MPLEPKMTTKAGREIDHGPPREMTGYMSQQEIDEARAEAGMLEAEDEVRDQDELEQIGETWSPSAE